MHIHRLDLHGYTVADAMQAFRRAYNRLAESGHGHALEVIHGKGTLDEGSAIRAELRSYLKNRGKRISGFDAQLLMRGADYLLDGCGTLAYMHGEDLDRNAGKTTVVPIRRLGSLKRET
ncbi:MAG: Smr/MutS family protein [Chloroflexota bacterium]|nr:Smr/MutS family protein [Chloroflexota bacterium]